MARTTTSLTNLFTNLIAPLTDAVAVETGKRLTLPAWGRVVRSLASTVLQALADAVRPTPTYPTAPAPEAPAVEPEPRPADPVIGVGPTIPSQMPRPVVVAVETVPADPTEVEPVAQPKPARKPRVSKPKAAPASPKAKPAPKARPKAERTRRVIPVPSVNQITKPKAKPRTAKPTPKKASKPARKKVAK